MFKFILTVLICLSVLSCNQEKKAADEANIDSSTRSQSGHIKEKSISDFLALNPDSISNNKIDLTDAKFEKVLSIPDTVEKSKNDKEVVTSALKPESKKQVKRNVQKKPKPVKDKPEIAFEVRKFNFGEIKDGETINYNFYFTNTGEAPLVVNSAKATCGCAQPSYPFVEINPGERGHIGVHYNSVGKQGLQNPKITVLTNASLEPIILELEGMVRTNEGEE